MKPEAVCILTFASLVSVVVSGAIARALRGMRARAVVLAPPVALLWNTFIAFAILGTKRYSTLEEFLVIWCVLFIPSMIGVGIGSRPGVTNQIKLAPKDESSPPGTQHPLLWGLLLGVVFLVLCFIFGHILFK